MTNPADRHLHPVDQEALRIYDQLWAIANEHRNEGRTVIANNIEDIAQAVYHTVHNRSRLRW